MDEDERLRRQQQLISDELSRKELEIETLKEMMGEPVEDSPFKPRASLARTPPGSFSPAAQGSRTPQQPISSQPSKRVLSSPEEVQEAVRRRTAKKSAAPPIGGILTSGPAAPSVGKPEEQPAVGSTKRVTSTPAPVPKKPTTQTGTATAIAEDGLPGLGTIDLLEKVRLAVKGISAVAMAANKLNMGDKSAIAAHGQDILAVVGALNIRLLEVANENTAMRLQVSKMELQAASGAPPAVATAEPITSYASKLKLPKGRPELSLEQRGPTVIFYPNSEVLKSSEDTKKELQRNIKPGLHGVQCQRLVPVANGGVAVQTKSAEAARKLKEAAPPTLKATDPKSRKPLVAIRNLRSDPNAADVLEDLYRINLAEDENWPKEKVMSQCSVAFKKGRRDTGRTTVVLECTGPLRDRLISLGRVYIGWDEADICDYVRVTCCNKCQQYGHPEKHCRAAGMVCGKCGEQGHKKDECRAESSCCATCKKFKRPNYSDHSTGAAMCPARLHAEQQAANRTHYG